MNIRTLPFAEWPRIEGVFVQMGSTLPNPEFAQILVAEEPNADGLVEIVGFIVTQLVPHIEPIWVAPARRGDGVWSQLADAAIKQFPVGQVFYAFTPTAAVEALANKAGLEKLDWSIHRGVSGVKTEPASAPAVIITPEG
jgi:hypothetical protein